jgi:hypothetical protein
MSTKADVRVARAAKMLQQSHAALKADEGQIDLAQELIKTTGFDLRDAGSVCQAVTMEKLVKAGVNHSTIASILQDFDILDSWTQFSTAEHMALYIHWSKAIEVAADEINQADEIDQSEETKEDTTTPNANIPSVPTNPELVSIETTKNVQPKTNDPIIDLNQLVYSNSFAPETTKPPTEDTLLRNTTGLLGEMVLRESIPEVRPVRTREELVALLPPLGQDVTCNPDLLNQMTSFEHGVVDLSAAGTIRLIQI